MTTWSNQIVLLTLREIYAIYCRLLKVKGVNKELSGHPGEFFNFYSIWKKSIVFEIPSGYIRIEPYPSLKSATVHGIFFNNPFKDIKLIKNMLYLYLEETKYIDFLECKVKKIHKGVHKLLSKMDLENYETSNEIIYIIRRIKNESRWL